MSAWVLSLVGFVSHAFSRQTNGQRAGLVFARIRTEAWRSMRREGSPKKNIRPDPSAVNYSRCVCFGSLYFLTGEGERAR